MPVPSIITDLSDTASSNFPQDSDSTGSTVASLPRAIQAILKKQFIRGSDITVSGAGVVTMPVENAYFVINGSGFAVSGFSSNYNGRIVMVEFTGALTLTHSASFIMPNATTITTAAGDTAIFVNETGSTWRAISYNKVTNVFATIASPVFTGDPQAPTPATGDNDTSIATTQFVKAQGYATLASPTFTGNPIAPTPSPGDNDTSIATTGFVTGAITTESALTVKLAGAQNVTGVKTFTGGNEPVAKNIVKAWAVFDGTLTGTNAPTNGFNVSNVQRTVLGSYVVTMTNALPNTNYAIVATCNTDSVGIAIVCESGVARTTTVFGLSITNPSSVAVDRSRVSFCVYGF